MKQQPRGRFTTEFKVEAVRLVKAGQSISMTAKVLGYRFRRYTIGYSATSLANSRALELSRCLMSRWKLLGFVQKLLGSRWSVTY
jgi:hypothetical protein